MHTRESSERWSQISAAIFPVPRFDISCFGYDWLGRQFALDTSRKSAKEGMVLMLDVELGQVYSTDCNMIDFHNIELVQGAFQFLAESEFREWLNSENGKPLAWSECVGFQIHWCSAVRTSRIIESAVIWKSTGAFAHKFWIRQSRFRKELE